MLNRTRTTSDGAFCTGWEKIKSSVNNFDSCIQEEWSLIFSYLYLHDSKTSSPYIALALTIFLGWLPWRFVISNIRR